MMKSIDEQNIMKKCTVFQKIIEGQQEKSAVGPTDW